MERAAAILLPLFSLRSDNDLGRGEILDLRAFARWMLEMEHRVLQLLPLSESAAGENSPYSALCVFSIDPLYISVADCPECRMPTLNMPMLRSPAGGSIPGPNCGR